MKITDPDVIKSGEKDLIDAVKDDLDLDTIKDIMQNKMNAKALVSKGGEIVVHNNAIAFRLDFSIEISGSLMFDRQGNYIPESDEENTLPIEDLDPLTDEPETDLETELDPEIDLESETETELETEIETEEDDLDQNDMIDDDDIIDDDIDDDIVDDDIVDDDIVDDDIVDDDINDILKESRDFWESKKDE